MTSNQSDRQSTATSHKCVECGSDLTDPKKRGDPDVNGDWVCSSDTCRAVHQVEMTCDVRVVYND